MRFKALFVFILPWTFAVYYPIAHMVWGQGGLLASISSVDFAGGNVVHISSGVSALVLCLALGKRAGFAEVSYRAHNIPLVALGATILLFGWFGFSAGSALAADGLAVPAFATTALSAAAAELGWMFMDVVFGRKPTLVGACTGLVIGLVAITPRCGYVPLAAALTIGFVGSVICYFTCSRMKAHFGYDDALDAFGCHGIGGIWGGIATGLFASRDVNPALQWNGLVFGDTGLIAVQIIAILVTIALAVVGSLVCIALTKALVGALRVSGHEERIGLDISQHGERAYPSFTGLDD